MAIYRKIYEQHHGPIPVDEDGRTYEIHHIDGNHANNEVDNLMACPIREHYDIHYKQGNYAAAQKIAIKMKLSHEMISELARLHQMSRVKQGIHQWQSEKYKNFCINREKEKYKKGNHITQTIEWKNLMNERMSGDKNPSKRPEIRQAISQSRSKDWEITFPSGKSIKITNMFKFCKENNLHVAALHRVAKGKQKHHKGFTAREIC